MYSAGGDVIAWATGGVYRMALYDQGIDLDGAGLRLDVMGHNTNDALPAVRLRNLHTTADDNTRVMQLFLGGGTNMNTAKFAVFSDSDGITGSISAAGATIVAFNITSDRRLKENIEYNWDALDIINKIRPVKFNFIKEPGRYMHGFIAQELNEILPEAVTVGSNKMEVARDKARGGEDFLIFDPVKNPEMMTSPLNKSPPRLANPWSVDYGKLTGVLAKAIQELSKKNDDLEKKAPNG